MKKESGEEYGKSETEKFLQLSRFGRYGAFQRCKKTFLYLRKRHVYCGTTDYKFIYSTAQRELFGFQLQKLDAKKMSVDGIIDECNVLPVFDDKKCVFVYDSPIFQKQIL